MSVAGRDLVTPARVSELLHARGLLAGAKLAAVRLREQVRAQFSIRASYDLEYKGSPAPQAPTRLLLKLSLPELDISRELLRNEVRFYREYGGDPRLPLVRCFDAILSDEGGASQLLLEDLSPTHGNPPPPMPPTFEQAEAMIDALLRFHLRWWDDTDVPHDIAERWTAATIDRVVRATNESYDRYREIVGDRFSKERWQIYEDVLPHWPRLLLRLVDQPNLTVIHGDAHAWNCLLPHRPDRDPAYLIDLSTCRIRPGMNDLAYMMGVFWFPDARKAWEEPLLRRYHRGVMAGGIDSYSWDDLRRDYRFAIIVHLFTPMSQAVGQILPAATWWNNAERITMAFEDLKCRELL